VAAGRASCSTTSKEDRWTMARSTARSMATQGSGGSMIQVKILEEHNNVTTALHDFRFVEF
jgi:hypothetical protein